MFGIILNLKLPNAIKSESFKAIVCLKFKLILTTRKGVASRMIGKNKKKRKNGPLLTELS